MFRPRFQNPGGYGLNPLTFLTITLNSFHSMPTVITRELNIGLLWFFSFSLFSLFSYLHTRILPTSHEPITSQCCRVATLPKPTKFGLLFPQFLLTFSSLQIFSSIFNYIYIFFVFNIVFNHLKINYNLQFLLIHVIVYMYLHNLLVHVHWEDKKDKIVEDQTFHSKLRLNYTPVVVS